MPTSSRLRDLVGPATTLRTGRSLLPGPAGLAGGPALTANGLFGGYFTAAADPANARVRLDLYWPGIRSATVERIHPDGTTHLVRGGDPALVCTGWARYDHEAPLDQAVTYQATSTERDGALVTTAAVTVTGTRDWLKHPTRPTLNRPVTIRELGPRNRAARRGVLRPPLRAYPIVVHSVRQAHAGEVILQTDGTAADLASLDELLNDGAELLLQRPATRGGESWYISVDTTATARLDPVHATLLIDRLQLPYERVERPPGTAGGDPGAAYTDLPEAHLTYNQIESGYATYLDLSMSAP